MSISVAVVANDTETRDRLTQLVPTDTYTPSSCTPDMLPETQPQLFIIALPGLETPEEALIEKLRADDATAEIPLVIVSTLPMIQLQSVPYASDWTIAIVEDPVDAQVLSETMGFLLNPGQ